MTSDQLHPLRWQLRPTGYARILFSFGECHFDRMQARNGIVVVERRPVLGVVVVLVEWRNQAH